MNKEEIEKYVKLEELKIAVNDYIRENKDNKNISVICQPYFIYQPISEYRGDMYITQEMEYLKRKELEKTLQDIKEYIDKYVEWCHRQHLEPAFTIEPLIEIVNKAIGSDK